MFHWFCFLNFSNRIAHTYTIGTRTLDSSGQLSRACYSVCLYKTDLNSIQSKTHNVRSAVFIHSAVCLYCVSFVSVQCVYSYPTLAWKPITSSYGNLNMISQWFHSTRVYRLCLGDALTQLIKTESLRFSTEIDHFRSVIFFFKKKLWLKIRWLP